jgi:signal transduction histidine kinase
LLSAARDDLGHGLADLRELARGIHPAVLTERGLGPALDALLTRAAVPVEIDEVPDERLTPALEAAAYYVIAESVANVGKYAGATHATISVERSIGTATVIVADDGVGGADPAQGTGLHGLAARVEALNGHLEIHSPPGQGTRITARLPLR